MITKESTFDQVRAKGERLFNSGAIKDLTLSPDNKIATAQVTGDHSTYDVTIVRGDPDKKDQWTEWECSCQWGYWAQERIYLGHRICSHIYAVLLDLYKTYCNMRLNDQEGYSKPLGPNGISLTASMEYEAEQCPSCLGEGYQFTKGQEEDNTCNTCNGSGNVWSGSFDQGQLNDIKEIAHHLNTYSDPEDYDFIRECSLYNSNTKKTLAEHIRQWAEGDNLDRWGSSPYLNKAIDLSPREFTPELYRYTTSKLPLDTILKTLEKGGLYGDRIRSFTDDPDFVNREGWHYTYGDDKTTLSFVLKPGAKALNIGHGYVNPNFVEQREWLTKGPFRVTRLTKGDDKSPFVRHLTVEMQPGRPSPKYEEPIPTKVLYRESSVKNYNLEPWVHPKDLNESVESGESKSPELLSDGTNNGAVWLLHFNDDTKGVWKKHIASDDPDESASAEVKAANLAPHFGVNVPQTIHHRWGLPKEAYNLFPFSDYDPGHYCGDGVLSRHVEGYTSQEKGEGFDLRQGGQSAKRMALFDWLISNRDRNSTNAIITPSNHLVGIDHEFSLGNFERTNNRWSDLASESEKDLQEELKKNLGRGISNSDYKGILSKVYDVLGKSLEFGLDDSDISSLEDRLNTLPKVIKTTREGQHRFPEFHQPFKPTLPYRTSGKYEDEIYNRANPFSSEGESYRYTPSSDSEHRSLVNQAISKWSNNPNFIRLDMIKEQKGDPIPFIGLEHERRKMAGALIWEIQNKGVPIPTQLFRTSDYGKHEFPRDGYQGWTPSFAAAKQFITSLTGFSERRMPGTKIYRLGPGEAKGLEIWRSPYHRWPAEKEWIVDHSTIRPGKFGSKTSLSDSDIRLASESLIKLQS